jgi:hypothetical protein
MLRWIGCALALLFFTQSSQAQAFRVGWRDLFTFAQGSPDTLAALAYDRVGNIFALFNVDNDVDDDVVIRKYSPTGQVLLSRRFEVRPGQGRPDFGYALAIDAAGWVYASIGAPIDSTVSQACIVKMNPTTGATVMTRILATGSQAFFPHFLRFDNAGNLVQGGGYGSNGRAQFAVVKYNSALTRLWFRTFKAPNTGDNEPLAMTIAPNNEIYLGGYTVTQTAGPDAMVVRFSAADGTRRWHSIWAGTEFGRDRVLALATSPTGALIASGWTYLSGSTVNAFTRRLNPDTGARIWYNTLVSPSNDSAEIGVAIGADGHVLGGGDYRGANPKRDLYVRKLNIANGATMFFRQITGAATSEETARAFTLDAFGNAYITGSSAIQSGSTTLTKFLTARVFGTTGAIRWQYRYAPGFGATTLDEPAAIAVNSVSGHVVTGGDFVRSPRSDGKLLCLFQAPEARNDAYRTPKNTTLVVSSPGLRRNDVFQQYAPTIQVVTPPSVGTLTVSNSGAIRYVPRANFTGNVTFTYRLVRTGLTPSVATVRITVGP